MPHSDILPVPEFVHTAFHKSPDLVHEALVSGLLDPLQLDPTCSTHVTGLLCAARENPTLPIPPAMLTAMSEYHLWGAYSHPAIAAHLATRLHEHGLGFILGRSSLTLRNTLPREVETALLDLVRHERLTNEQISDLRTLNALSTASRTTLLTLIRSRASKKAAVTRKQQQQSTQSLGTPIPSPKIDPLLSAIRSGDPARLNHFQLRDLDPARVRTMLSDWLAAPNSVKASLLQTRSLPLDAKLLALEAWVASNHWDTPVDPVEASLLERLSTAALDIVLTCWIRGRLQLTPIPDEAALLTPLFRLALDHPARAAWIRNGVRLMRWLTQLNALASTLTPPQPLPDDPEARWIHLLAEHFDTGITQTLGIALMDAYSAWPPLRQRALVSPLRTIVEAAVAAN